MREDSRVPPSRSSPGTGDQPADGARTVPPTQGESSLAVPTTAPADGALEQEESAKPSSPLPRRVRGTNGARSPARVERPVLPESFVERFRAAAAVSDAREAEEEGNAAGGHETADDRSAGPDQATQSKPAASSSSLPHRVRGENGARKPPAMLRPPPSLSGFPNRSDAGEDTQIIPGGSGAATAETRARSDAGEDTQIIPGGSDAATAETRAGAASTSAAVGHVSEGAASGQDAPVQEAAGETPASAVTAESGRPMRATSAEPVTKPPVDRRPAARPFTPPQGSMKRRASRKTTPSAAAKNRTGRRRYRMIGLLVIVAALAAGAGSFAALHHSEPRWPQDRSLLGHDSAGNPQYRWHLGRQSGRRCRRRGL